MKKSNSIMRRRLLRRPLIQPQAKTPPRHPSATGEDPWPRDAKLRILRHGQRPVAPRFEATTQHLEVPVLRTGTAHPSAKGEDDPHTPSATGKDPWPRDAKLRTQYLKAPVLTTGTALQRDLIADILPLRIPCNDQIVFPQALIALELALAVYCLFARWVSFKINERVNVVLFGVRAHGSGAMLLHALSQVAARPNIDRTEGP